MLLINNKYLFLIVLEVGNSRSCGQQNPVCEDFLVHAQSSFAVSSHGRNGNVAETKCHTRRVRELRFVMLAGPEELTLQALSPDKGLTEFI